MKDRHESQARLQGLFNIAVTPFDSEGNFDFAALEQNIERVIGLGFDGVLIGGTYGEFAVMDVAERVTLFRRAMAIIGDRVPAMLCSASADPRVARDLTALAGDLGGLPMVTPPYVTEITDEQIIAFFKQVAPLSRTGLLIYNAPGIGVTLSPPVIEALADVEGVVGIKQGDLTPTVIDAIANRLSGRLRLFCASDLAFHGPMMAGFDGLSSTNSCALPELILAAFRALERGEAVEARELQRLWYSYRELARRHGQPQLVKAAMRLRGFNGGYVRAPLIEIAASVRKELSDVLTRLSADRRASIGAIAA